MHQCDHCDYKSARIWCINRHIKTKHGEIQKGSGVTDGQNHNKQWQAAYRQLQAWREEDGVYANEEIQQLSYLNSDPRR